MTPGQAEGGRLLLFDIDCTLVDTGGAGMRAICSAAGDFFDDPAGVPDLDLAGSTDGGIVRGLFAHFRREHSGHEEAAFFERYLFYLDQNLRDARFGGRVLAGVSELLERLAKEEIHVSGLLTGNIARGAEAKLRRFGLHHHFAFGAYGDDHHDRNRLGPVALERALAAHGRQFVAERTVVIGDTPKDIACGKAFGATTVAVATGRFSAAELRAHAPDLVLNDLADITDLLRLLDN